MGLIREVREFLRDFREERKRQHELVAEVLHTSKLQAQAMDRVVSVVEAMMKGFDVTGLPSSERHMTEEQEAEMLEEIYYGRDSAIGRDERTDGDA